MLTTKSSLVRIWHYFKIGYGSYMAIPLSFLTTLIAVYYLAIDNIPVFKSVFSRFWLFSLAALVFGIPTACAVGWLHTRKTGVSSFEHNAGEEANLNNCQLQPKYWQETLAPLHLELLKGIGKILEREEMLNEDDEERIKELEDKLQASINSDWRSS